MKIIESQSGNGKLRREDDGRLYDVQYEYEVREVIPGHPYQLAGKLTGVNWELGQTLNGNVCILYLSDGRSRHINVFMMNPFSDCTFNAAPGGEDW